MQKLIYLLIVAVGIFGCQPKSPHPTLITFTATWCEPCKQVRPILEQLKEKIKVIDYDFDRNKKAVRKYKIRAVPTFILGDLRTHNIREVITALGMEQEFANAFAEKLTAGTLSTCSRWASERRVMSGDFAGKYGWKYHPWVKSLHDTRATFNYVMKGAQLGITEVAINRALYTLDKLKRDVLYVLPTAKGASKFSKGRFTVALSLSPYIRSMFTDLNSIDLKQAGNCTLYLSGSRGNNNLKNIPVSELILDELDEMDQAQIYLALERLSGQLRKCVWGISTPTVPAHGIHKVYQGSTQEHFMFQCPYCGRHTELVWPDCVEMIGEYETDVRCKESFLKCKECQHKLEQKDKPIFLAGGKWEPTAKNINKDVRGFYINQLYSYTVNAGELVSAFLRGFGDELAATEFWNSKLGLPFVAEGAQISEQMLDATIAEHSMNDVRPMIGGEKLITLGVDQGDMFNAVVCEWNIDGDASRDLSAASLCKVLWVGKHTSEDWGWLDQLMSEWQVLYAVIDADPHTNEARRFARRYPGFVGLTRYRRVKNAKEITTTEEETRGVSMHQCDRSSWISAVMSRFKSNPCRILLPRDIPHEFKQHLMSTVRTFKRDDHGNPSSHYVEVGPDHYLHCLVYNEISLHFSPMLTDTRIGKVL